MSRWRRRTYEVVFTSNTGTDQPWHWRCRAANGEILCHSEAYANKAHAEKMARSFARLFDRVVVK